MVAAAPVLPQLAQVFGPAIAAGLATFAGVIATRQPPIGSPIIMALQELDRRLAIDRSKTRYQILTELDGIAQELLGREEARQHIQVTGLTLEQARAQAIASIDQNIGLIGPFQVPTPRFRTTAEAAEWYRSTRDQLQLEADRGDVTAQDQILHNYSYYLGEVARLNRTLFFPPGWILGEGGFERDPGPTPWAPPAGYVRGTDPRADYSGIPAVDPATGELWYPPRADAGAGTGTDPGGVPGSLDIPGLAGGIAGGLVQGLPAVLGLGAAGLTATGELLWRGIGRAQHQGRLECQTSTWATILRNIAGAAVPLAIPTVLLKSDIGHNLVEDFGSQALDLVLTGGGLDPHVTPDTAPANAAKLLIQKMQLGAAAHMWAASAEAATPMKTLGLNTFGAALADLAGFQRLAFATIGQVETAAVLLPMQQHAMRKYRSQLPGLVDVATAYAKKELPPGPIPEGWPPRAAFTPTDPNEPAANMHEVLSRYGMPDWWIRTASHHLFMDPRMSEIVRMGQYFSPAIDPSTATPTEFADKWIDARPWVLQLAGVTRAEWDADWWLHFRIAVGGYAYEDIKVVRETIKRAVVRRDQTLMLDAITRMHREGFIGDVELEGLVREAWGQTPGPDGRYTFRGDPILARVRATQFRTDYEVRNDVKTLVLRAMTKGVESESEAMRDLQKLGMPETRAKLEVLRAKLGLLPGVNLTIPLEGTGAEGEGE